MNQGSRRLKGASTRGKRKCSDALTAEARDKPKEQRKRGAKYEARDDREIESDVLAAMDDIAGKFSEAKREFAAEVQKSAQNNKEPAEDEDGATEFAERVHSGILPETAREPFPPKDFC
jgi:hypothetical protein